MPTNLQLIDHSLPSPLPLRGGLYAARHFHFLDDGDTYAPDQSDIDFLDLPPGTGFPFHATPTFNIVNSTCKV